MAKFRKKPVVVEAEQWQIVDPINDGRNGYHLGVGFFRRPDWPGNTTCNHCCRAMHDHGWIDTLEGGHIVCPGDFVITGVKGEKYPCKPDIFEATYEPVAE